MADTPLLAIRHVSKSYGGVQALRDVSLSIAPGEVHALCGENGAGKSTLIKIIAGSVVPDSGEVFVNGSPLALGDIRASEDAGIAVIHQESAAFLHLNAEDNIFVGREPKRLAGLLLDRPAMRNRTRELLDQLGERFDRRCPLQQLTIAQRQMVGMARALLRRGKLLIMDEPTASLSARETRVLFRIIRQLREQGMSILYVSHRLEEVFELSDRVTIFRDGQWVCTEPTRSLTTTTLIQKMVGREVGLVAKRDSTASAGPVLLEVTKLSRAGVFEDVSLTVRAGEIVGLAGLVGAGRSEVAQAVFGIDRPDAGDVRIDGHRLPRGSIRHAMAAGVDMVPEDRQHLGLVLPMSVGQNLSMAILDRLTTGPFISGAARFRDLSQRMMKDLSIKAAGANIAVETLSGGNQQKVMLGKWLAPNPRVLLLDEPTRGIDVGAKAEVHRLIRELAASGMATLLISSEMPELLSLADRIVVMREGRIAGELTSADASQEKLLELALPKS